MLVRKMTAEDMPVVMDIYREARGRMREGGNPNQWTGSYPDEGTVSGDLGGGVAHVIEKEGAVVGCFALIPGKDPTYGIIYGGGWERDELPYLTLHRLAGRSSERGIASCCLSWCKSRGLSLRADTHRDNSVMRHVLEGAGFVRRGTIRLAGGDERIAYQWINQ